MDSKKSFKLLVVSNTTPFFRSCPDNLFPWLSENLYFHISDPLTRFRKWKFPNFGREKGGPPLQQDFHQDFHFFPLKIQVLECWQYRKLEKIWFYTKNGKKTQIFYSKS